MQLLELHKSYTEHSTAQLCTGSALDQFWIPMFHIVIHHRSSVIQTDHTATAVEHCLDSTASHCDPPSEQCDWDRITLLQQWSTAWISLFHIVIHHRSSVIHADHTAAALEHCLDFTVPRWSCGFHTSHTTPSEQCFA